jgi:hypothetical protein
MAGDAIQIGAFFAKDKLVVSISYLKAFLLLPKVTNILS